MSDDKTGAPPEVASSVLFAPVLGDCSIRKLGTFDLSDGRWMNRDGSVNETLTSLVMETSEMEFEHWLLMARISRKFASGLSGISPLDGHTELLRKPLQKATVIFTYTLLSCLDFAVRSFKKLLDFCGFVRTNRIRKTL